MSQDFVARRMAEAVIDVLEAVQIEQQQGRRLATFARRLHPVGQELAVGDARQMVDLGLAPQLRLGGAPVRHVPGDRPEQVSPVFGPVGEGRFQRKLRPIAAHRCHCHQRSDEPRRQASRHAAQAGFMRGAQGGRNDQAEGLAHHLLGGVTEGRLGRAVPERDAVVFVGADDRIKRQRRDGFEAFTVVG
jgi:hypothetical protein